jgi:threonine-phosphate decarboxylase
MDSRSASVQLPAHGGQLRAIAAQFSIPENKLLDFSANIYPGGPPPGVLKALADAIRNQEYIRAYPDLESLELREGLANYVHVPVGNLLVANGMVPLFSATLRAIDARKCLLPVPAFGEYRRTFHREGLAVETYPLTRDADFRPDREKLLACCNRKGCDTLILTNPHNPTGALLQRTELQTLVQSAETCGVRVLLDEAFIDFVPNESLSEQVLQSNNLFVFRSVTKFFALAGLRVAYMIAPQRFASAITGQLDPWPISAPASIATIAAVNDSPYIVTTIACVQSEREMLRGKLSGLGLTVYPSQANCLFFRLSDAERCRNLWERLILEHGIVVRNCATFEGLDATFFRVAVRRAKDNQRLVQALDALLNEVA